MTDLTLTIGDKTMSSWSFRPWFLMKHADIPFTEETVRLDRPETRKTLAEISPAGLVPFLTHGSLKVWDSLAIMEYVSELYPEKRLWPEALEARAVARAAGAEMHSGFSALRTVWPMYFTRENLNHLTSGGVARDIARIDALWTECRTRFGAAGDSQGPFLFGRFSVADAMYAPVVSRFVTYGPVSLSPQSAAYMETIRALPAFIEWGEDAKAEQFFE